MYYLSIYLSIYITTHSDYIKLTYEGKVVEMDEERVHRNGGGLFYNVKHPNPTPDICGRYIKNDYGGWIGPSFLVDSAQVVMSSRIPLSF